MGDREVHRGDVVVGDEGGVDPLHVAVDEGDRQPALTQPGVALGRGAGVGVLAGDVDDPGDPAAEEHLDVVVLVDAALGLRAQHRGEAAVRERDLDGLGEGGEDRVGQLGDDETDERDRRRAQPGRAVVAQDVDRGEDGLTGALGDPRPLVEDPRDGRLAHAGVGREIGEPGAARGRAPGRGLRGMVHGRTITGAARSRQRPTLLATGR